MDKPKYEGVMWESKFEKKYSEVRLGPLRAPGQIYTLVMKNVTVECRPITVSYFMDLMRVPIYHGPYKGPNISWT